MNEHKKHDKDMQKEFKKHLGEAASTFKEIKHPGKFDFKKEFMNAIEILKLNEKTMHDIALRKTTATAAFLFILMGTVSMGLGMYFMLGSMWRPPVSHLLFSFVYYLVAMFLWIFVTDFVASQFFKGKGTFGQLFRVIGYSYVIMIPYLLLAVAPGLLELVSFITGIWLLVVTYKIISVIKKLNPTHTIFTIIIVAVAFVILSALLMQLGIGTVGYGYGAEINSLNEAMEALSQL
jgi:hypothetical protein